MNSESFRHLYDYHFAANRKVWDEFIQPLPQEKFVQDLDYSVGSIRNHIIHLINVDNAWFSNLQGDADPQFLNPDDYVEKEKIQSEWDQVEQKMRDYLADLQDDMLMTQPLLALDDDPSYLWQTLIHVVNHGTDHRAQLLMTLHQMGVKTNAQDYVFYIYDAL